MDYELSDAHKLIRNTAKRIAREKVAPRAAELDESGVYPEDIFQVFAEAGLLGLTIPEQYGGSGAGFLALALAVEETAKYDNSCSLILLLSALATQPINLSGSDEQKHEWLPQAASGAIKGAFCLTEPNTGSDAAALESRAAKDGDDYVINGEKVFISGGDVADFVCYFAKTGDDGASAISAFIVPTDSPGFSVPRCDRKMGVIGVPTANIVLQDCRVPAGLRIGEENRGFKTAMLTLNTCRPVVGARGLGLAEGAIAYALDFARERKTFGRPLVDHQAIQFMLADAAIGIEGSRHLVYHAASLVDEGKYEREWAPYLSIAKTYATEVANKVASDAIQILGAQGYMKDHPLERHYRDARQLMIVEGTSQIQRLVIARAMIQGDINYW
ncbi:MAG: acyl-CoA dehydrogenase family protein [Chloroflexi bacterium]|nr:acyl-CoA dehydrogenase family protein [Chloroflexota bacterium]MCI0817300.1 acyl-CoA dehydrogenase family protein [Chloroflexota bacterium]MCI0839776.1 acyl-CoA dehydrogenase family protein [Chloroflexota bacterium]MCI0883051.1 acyl-CoA dehydrogenase family protein [Chloroflexota bacterium]MCI0886555.1 acyl-CoA dehydrogenase family protein [Chloroflexota bacterium]